MRKFLMIACLFLLLVLLFGCGEKTPERGLEVHRFQVMTDHLLIGPFVVVTAGQQLVVLDEGLKVVNVTGESLGFVRGHVTFQRARDQHRFYQSRFMVVEERDQQSFFSASTDYSERFHFKGDFETLLVTGEVVLEGATLPFEKTVVLEEVRQDLEDAPGGGL